MTDIDASRVIGNLDAASFAGKDGALEGLIVGGEHILGVSNSRVPFKEGDLSVSGSVSDDGEGTVAVSYDTDYAVRQHEDLSLNHDAGREAKFLERALNEERDVVLQMVATAVKRKVGL